MNKLLKKIHKKDDKGGKIQFASLRLHRSKGTLIFKDNCLLNPLSIFNMINLIVCFESLFYLLFLHLIAISTITLFAFLSYHYLIENAQPPSTDLQEV